MLGDDYHPPLRQLRALIVTERTPSDNHDFYPSARYVLVTYLQQGSASQTKSAAVVGPKVILSAVSVAPLAKESQLKYAYLTQHAFSPISAGLSSVDLGPMRRVIPSKNGIASYNDSRWWQIPIIAEHAGPRHRERPAPLFYQQLVRILSADVMTLPQY
jgi:hypothetical protein